ncbi:monoamine oxidase [Geosmithia morbida]|uniref:Amine oxidase n=1 Tax=Geosmithia morbida TaxID=1094350 RepID=A0A9P4YNA8_9HYPO|nr:monoamine oxidase [Geosmithia morbida]KAF4120098.1 monoamine oxidase [Geosmithia morbida]
MHDVVVIGAGLSGLQAARSCQLAGLSVSVIEARDRVGGKVWSVPLRSGRGYADLGAAWINDRLQSRINAYVQQFGLETVRQRLDGKAVMQKESGDRIVYPFGITPEFTAEEKKNLEFVRDHIQSATLKTTCPGQDEDSVSLDEYVRKLGAGPTTVKMVNLWSRVMHGVESKQQSAAWFIEYCRRNHGLLAVRADDESGGNHMRITTGTQDIANGLANLVGRDNIHLSSPVVSAHDYRSHVTVTTAAGQTFQAHRCIISLPSTMYKSLSIAPPLPESICSIVNCTTLGHYNKAIVCYDKPWWRDLGFNGFLLSYKGPVVVARDTSVDSIDYYALTCFVNGDEGTKWQGLSHNDRRQVVLDQIAEVYYGDISEKAASIEHVYQPSDFFIQIWKEEVYSKGALAPITAIGQRDAYETYCGKPVGNYHFVGTEYATEWKGYMEGALCSGEHGAAEVVQALAIIAKL